MGRIVVGVDGSPASAEALRFALAEARARGATLCAVHVWLLPLSESIPDAFLLEGPLEPSVPFDEVVQSAEKAAHERFDEALRDVLGDGDPGVELEREVVEGEPVRVLLERAKTADLLVVGTRGRGGFAGLLLGSVATQVSHHSPCPVVIVPASADSGHR